MPAPIPFVRDLDVAYGRVDQVSPLIRRVVAENPSKFTYLGRLLLFFVRSMFFLTGRQFRGGYDLIAIFSRQISHRLLSGPQHSHVHLWRGRLPGYSFVVGLLLIAHVFLWRRVNSSLRDSVRIESPRCGKCAKPEAGE
jgi:hypothetical protein